MGAYVSRGRVFRPRAEKPKQPTKPNDDHSVNVNEADIKVLTTINGVGKKTAADIIASREADGPFESLEQCAERVGGVSLEQLEAAGAAV